MFFFDLSYIGYKAISSNLHMAYIILYTYIKLYNLIFFKKLMMLIFEVNVLYPMSTTNFSNFREHDPKSNIKKYYEDDKKKIMFRLL